jgi:deoxycytidine triphosphate deaminase
MMGCPFMAFLTDSELKELLKSANPPIRGLDLSGNLDSIGSPIQPCSVDLRISEVFLPFRDEKADVNAVRRTSHHSLGVGESVKVTTVEEFDLGNDHGALLVAPARLTRRGIIVPDVGHVDPGFRGRLRITLINMGRHPYDLRSGDSIVTVLLFRLATPVAVGLRHRTDGVQPYEKGLEDIRHLSADLLNIESRVEKLASDVARTTLGESGWRRAFFSWCLPIIIGILTALVTYYVHVESRLAGLEAKSQLSTEIQQLERRIDELELKLKNVTDVAPTRGAGSREVSTK